MKPRTTLSALVFLLCLAVVVAAQAKTPGAPATGTLGEKKSASFIVTLSSAPAAPVRGLATLEAFIADASGAAVTDAQLSFDLNMTTMNHGKNVVAAASQGDGRYVGQVRFMMPGPWRVIVRVARPSQAPEDLRFEFNVKFR
jgi:hypothetical protein